MRNYTNYTTRNFKTADLKTAFTRICPDRTYTLASGVKVRVFESVQTGKGTIYTGVEIDSHGNTRMYFPDDADYEDFVECKAVPCVREFKEKDVIRRSAKRRNVYGCV